MTRDEAFELLTSSSSRERLVAAQFYVRNSVVSDIPHLQRARQTENDSYVLRRLDQALSRFVMSGYGKDVAREADFDFADSTVLAKAIEWVGRLLLHEMEGPIGRVALYASREVEAYATSKTKVELEGLQLIFSGLTVLIEASRLPRRTDFDLASLISDVIDSEIGEALDVSMHGAKPFIIEADPSLVRLALINGVKNAAEAIIESGASNSEHPIVVTWGKSDREYWISVIDSGPGVKGSVEDRFKAGDSSKQGHPGFGLAVARRAMESLGGTVSLESPLGGGASYELRWSLS